MALVRQLFEIFVTNTSMRGFMKLYRTPHTVLRIIWSLYLITMICLLMAASYFLVEHYTSFLVTVKQYERLQDITPMPSIAICSERPIGDHAADLWFNGSVLSPMRLHSELRRSMQTAYNLSNSGKKKGKFFAAKDLFFADKISTYFQNVGIEDGKRIGVQANDLVLFCIMKHSYNNVPSISHDDICKISIKWIRHPLYMNCYDITIDEKVSPEICSVSLILRSGLDSKSDPEGKQSQPFDIFTQSVGMRIALHDPGSFPSIDDHGVSIGLRKNTQLRYSLERHQRLNLGLDHSSCISQEEVSKLQPISDFKQNFSYSFHGCMSQAIGKVILDQCNCVSAWHLSSTLPSSTVPFCDLHNATSLSEMASRLDCFRNVQVQNKIQQLRRSSCLHRCDFNRYRVQISSSDWIPTQWQLKLILKMSPVWDQAVSKKAKPERKRKAHEHLKNFIFSDHPHHKLLNISDFDLNRLTLVTITRSSYNTVIKGEALQITLSTLLAQLGGMGSLTIGLTLTFLFEIFEFLYLSAVNLRKRLMAGRQRPEAEEQADQQLALTESQAKD